MSDAADNTETSFVSHLVELRNRLLYVVGAVLVLFVPLAIFSLELFDLIARPLLRALPQQSNMVAINVTDPFLIPLKLALMVAVVLAIPYILYQAWAFVAPGLYKHERRMVLPLLASSSLLFYLGMVFAYFVVFPLVFGFLMNQGGAAFQVMPSIGSYLGFVFTIFIAFGVAFEVPVAMVLLTSTGVMDPDALATKRPYVLLWAFVIGMFLTPPDAISQTLLAIPMYLLFEIGLIFSRRIKRRRQAEDDETVLDKEMQAYERDIGED